MDAMIEVTPDAVVLVDWGGTLARTADGWAAEFRCSVAPYAAGQQVTGVAYQQLLLLGFTPSAMTVLEYAGDEAPAAAQVGSDMLQWVGQTHATLAAQWLGRRVVAGVEAAS